MNLLLEIARCPNIKSFLPGTEQNHPCYRIVSGQGVASDEFQVPEPWSGHLGRAPVLFIGSNPSISGEEAFPRQVWADDRIEDFFENRFAGGTRQWIRSGVFFLKQDGTFNHTPVRFWQSVKDRMIEIAGRLDVEPGEDYAVSELVHCKSKGEDGIESASEECARRYLRRVIENSGAGVVVGLGRHAEQAIRGEFSLHSESAMAGPIVVGAHRRLFAFLPHPAWRAPDSRKTFVACLSRVEFNRLRGAVKEATKRCRHSTR